MMDDTELVLYPHSNSMSQVAPARLRDGLARLSGTSQAIRLEMLCGLMLPVHDPDPEMNMSLLDEAKGFTPHSLRLPPDIEVVDVWWSRDGRICRMARDGRKKLSNAKIMMPREN